MSAERSPHHRHLQEVRQIGPAAVPHAFLESTRPQEADGNEQSADPAPEPPPAPDPKAELTSTQTYRAHLAASHVRATKGIDFAEAAPADQILWLNQLRGDVIELLRMIRDTTSGL